MRSHVAAFTLEGVPLLHDHVPIGPDKEAPEWVLARFAGVSRDSKGAPQKTFVIKLW
jgi:hypothetical protein